MARELLSQDDAGENMLRVFEREPQLFISVFIEDQLAALAQVNEPGTLSYLTVYVAPLFRRQGIGSAVVRYAEEKLRTGGTEKVRSSFRANYPSTLTFAHKLGYGDYFSSSLMRRTGGPFPMEKLEELPVRSYTDQDYTASQSLYAEAFHEMRVRVGSFPDSVVAQPSEQERRSWLEDAQDRFVYVLNGEIAAYAHLSTGEISSISVRSDLQGHGIGKTFMRYLCNEIYRRGYANVDLWCVVGNNARILYDRLGFEEKYTMQFVRKTL